MNYGNRNASSTYTIQDLGRGYCGAVVVSMGLAMQTRILFANHLKKLKGPTAIFANAGINLFAASAAGACNLILMRQKELKEGISVYNEDGSIPYGKSKKAGKKAI